VSYLLAKGTNNGTTSLQLLESLISMIVAHNMHARQQEYFLVEQARRACCWSHRDGIRGHIGGRHLEVNVNTDQSESTCNRNVISSSSSRRSRVQSLE